MAARAFSTRRGFLRAFPLGFLAMPAPPAPADASPLALALGRHRAALAAVHAAETSGHVSPSAFDALCADEDRAFTALLRATPVTLGECAERAAHLLALHSEGVDLSFGLEALLRSTAGVDHG